MRAVNCGLAIADYGLAERVSKRTTPPRQSAIRNPQSLIPSSWYQTQPQRRRARHARRHAHPTPHAPLGLEDGMAAGVEGERALTHGTGAGAHAARDAMERDAALR